MKTLIIATAISIFAWFAISPEAMAQYVYYSSPGYTTTYYGGPMTWSSSYPPTTYTYPNVAYFPSTTYAYPSTTYAYPSTTYAYPYTTYSYPSTSYYSYPGYTTYSYSTPYYYGYQTSRWNWPWRRSNYWGY